MGRLLGGESALTRLRARFPKAFCIPPKPLAVGLTEIAFKRLYPRYSEGFRMRPEETPEGRELIRAIATWCSMPAYLAACSHAGSPRFDLEGEVAGEVTPEQCEFAARKFQEIEKKLRD